MSAATAKSGFFSWRTARFLLKWGTILAVIGAIIVALLFVYALNHYGKQVPSVQEYANYEPAITSRVHAGDGLLIAEFAQENRVFVPFESIPPHVVNAFVSSEDQNFWKHDGVDYWGVIRAVRNSVMNKIRGSGGLQGGSTITQQVAKNLLFSSDQTFERKFKEMIAAWRLEDALTKEQIIEIYMNEIYLGGSSYGVAAAAMNYFDKSLEELDISEAAVLASLPKFPGRVNPYRNPERLLSRRAYVISRMVHDGYISQAQADIENDRPLTTRRRFRGPEYEAATYFVQELRRDLTEEYGEEALQRGGLSIRSTIDSDLQLAAQRALANGLVIYDRRHDYRGPLAHFEINESMMEQLNALEKPPGYGTWEAGIFTEISSDSAKLILQGDGAETIIPKEDLDWARRTFEQEDGENGLRVGDVVLLEVTREVPEVMAAPVTDADMATAEAGGASEREAPPEPQAVPVGQSILRQIPDVEGALIALDPHTGRVLAMAGGYSFYRSQLNRVTQTRRQIGSSFKPFVYAAALEQGFTPSSQILDMPITVFDVSTGRDWRPGNYVEGQWGGLSTLRVGLEKSRNLMTIRLAQDIGMERVSEIATRLGIYDELDPFLAMSLGAGESSVWRLARAYATLVNGGREVELTMLDRVQNRHGETLYRADERSCPSCNANAWDGGPPPQLSDNRRQLMDPITAYQTVEMLKGVVERGTARRARAIGRPVAGKTGTTNDYRDALFFGFSPDMVVGVWVGKDDNSTLGYGEAGGSVAAPIFTEFMTHALADAPALPFRRPPGVRMVSVDARTGQLPGPDTVVIIEEAFRPGTEPGFDFFEIENLTTDPYQRGNSDPYDYGTGLGTTVDPYAVSHPGAVSDESEMEISGSEDVFGPENELPTIDDTPVDMEIGDIY